MFNLAPIYSARKSSNHKFFRVVTYRLSIIYTNNQHAFTCKVQQESRHLTMIQVKVIAAIGTD